eukprot:1886518-Rhodomonas_salina.2
MDAFPAQMAANAAEMEGAKKKQQLSHKWQQTCPMSGASGSTPRTCITPPLSPANPCARHGLPSTNRHSGCARSTSGYGRYAVQIGVADTVWGYAHGGDLA